MLPGCLIVLLDLRLCKCLHDQQAIIKLLQRSKQRTATAAFNSSEHVLIYTHEHHQAPYAIHYAM
jgi:hypothetical protein